MRARFACRICLYRDTRLLRLGRCSCWFRHDCHMLRLRFSALAALLEGINWLHDHTLVAILESTVGSGARIVEWGATQAQALSRKSDNAGRQTFVWGVHMQVFE